MRFAQESDIQLVADMTDRFNSDYFDIPINWDKFERWYEQHMNMGIILLSERGFISGLHISDPVRDWDVLVETAWWSEDRSGIRLLRSFIDYARDCGDQEVRITTLNTSPAGIITLLNRMGFEEIEKSHRLTL